MTINSTDFYQIIQAWTIKYYLTYGVRKIKVYLKYNRSIADPQTIQYETSQVTEEMEGHYIYVDLDAAKAQIQSEKEKIVTDLEYDILALQAKIEKTNLAYSRITYEE